MSEHNQPLLTNEVKIEFQNEEKFENLRRSGSVRMVGSYHELLQERSFIESANNKNIPDIQINSGPARDIEATDSYIDADISSGAYSSRIINRVP